MKRLLGISLVIIISLAILSGLLYYQNDNLKRQENTLQNQIGELESENAELAGQITILQDQVSELENKSNANRISKLQTQLELKTLEIADLRDQISAGNAEISELQNQIELKNSEMANLKEEMAGLLEETTIITKLGATDVRSPGKDGNTQPRLYISGDVWNNGILIVQVKLHVVLYQGTFVVKDTYVGIGTMTAGSSTYISRNVSYNGPALTHWTITPLWERI